LRWLGGYRHPRHGLPELRAVFAAPTLLMVGTEVAGDLIAVLPVLFHLLWRHELATDRSVTSSIRARTRSPEAPGS
jgi:hypothetical protein